MRTESTHFEGILDGYFERLLDENPVYATFAGLKSGEGKLGEATLAFEKNRAVQRRKALAALEQGLGNWRSKYLIYKHLGMTTGQSFWFLSASRHDMRLQTYCWC